MSIFQNIIISTTLHEPVFRLKKIIEKSLPFINQHLKKIVVCCSPTTDNDVITFLKNNGFLVYITAEDRVIETYLNAIQQAINNLDDTNADKILYVDFDRLIHWISNYPDELLEILNKVMTFELLHIGRTSRAFETHPETQKYTESIINKFGSYLLGVNEPMDLISVCFSFTKSLADMIINSSYSTITGFYGAWPVLLWALATDKEYIEVEGQEWETPDRFQEELEVLGYEKWFNEFQSSVEWDKRLNMLEDCILEMSRQYKFKLKILD